MKNRKLPTVLTTLEVNSLLSQPKSDTIPGLRDKTILEIMYSCGLRVSELTNLTTKSISHVERVCRVKGKGNKERLIPVTNSVVKWVDKYVTESRANHPARASATLFPNYKGKPLSRMAIWNLVNKYAQLAGIEKNIHPHTLRHSIATHFYEQGIDLLAIRDLLGHDDISTTQIYTHTSIAHLKDAFKRHPRR